MARNIYSADGSMLLSKGVALNERYISRLKNLFIPGIYISIGDMAFDVDLPEDILSEETRVAATKNVYRTFQKCQLTDDLDIGSVQETTRRIVEELLTNRTHVVQMTGIRRYDQYTFCHSISVCALAAMIGVLRGYTPKRLSEISIGALLHDIGKVKIPTDILNKRGKLDENEMCLMKTHSEQGFQLLRRNRQLSVVPMHVAYQHHERYDGTGYPRGLKGDHIHEYARIVAIADVYDALTSDRAYKKACTPFEAYQIMIEGINRHFDPELLELFFDHVAVYPVGTTLQLSDFNYAIVTEVQSGATFAPKVKILATASRMKVNEDLYIDLSQETSLSIRRVLDEAEIFDLLESTKQFRFL